MPKSPKYVSSEDETKQENVVDRIADYRKKADEELGDMFKVIKQQEYEKKQ